MKKKFLALLLAIVSAFCLVFASCGDNGNNDNPPTQKVDYAAQVKLDMTSETQKANAEFRLENHIDGDTTHFLVPNTIVASGKLKARYLAVNTPESTGQIQEWGKKASRYTKEHLSAATSIILETNATEWEVDSTGERYLVWVWYKTAEMTDYRCLNIELLQEGLAVGSKASSTRYGETCVAAIDQASRLKLHVHSNDLDPEYYYGAAIILSLKDLCLNKEDYLGKRVAFEGVITKYYNNGVYVEEYDEATDMYFAFYAYYGFGLSTAGQKVLSIGNRVRIVGEVSNQFGYQVSNLTYDPYHPEEPDHIYLYEKNAEIPCTEITADMYSNQSYTLTWSEEGEDGTLVEKTHTAPFLELAHYTHVSMKGLYVSRAYTTNNGGDNTGAITLTCTLNGKTITVRTAVLYEGNELVTQDRFVGKTIDVSGIIDMYEEDYQIKVFDVKDIVVH